MLNAIDKLLIGWYDCYAFKWTNNLENRCALFLFTLENFSWQVSRPDLVPLKNNGMILSQKQFINCLPVKPEFDKNLLLLGEIL